MKTTARLVSASFLLLIATAAAAQDEVRRRYLVGTAVPAWAFEHRLSNDRSLVSFQHVDALAVELTDAELIELAERTDVLYVEPDYERHASRVRGVPPAPGRPPEEEPQTTGYGVNLTRAEMLWSATRGGAGVRVGVIDSGIDITHPDLADRFRGGHDFVNNDDDPQDDNGHGTHVAGIIGASGNAFGVIGVAPAVDLFGLKVLDANGNGTGSGLIRAVEWAIDNELDVINMSLGGGGFSTTENLVFNRAVEAGMVCVAASGNGFPTNTSVDYPGAYDAVIAVGAVDSSEVVASFSQRGAALELMGAGVAVNSTFIVPSAYRVLGDGLPDMAAQPMDHSPRPDSIAGTLIVVSGLGQPGDFPSSVSGNVALIERGTITFREKSQNAKNAGATAAIIYNNVPGEFLGTLCSDQTNCTPPNVPVDPILTVSLSQENGQILLGHSGDPLTLSKASLSTYGLLDGTSMATPHVAGVAALLKALDPLASPAEIRNAMNETAKDLGDAGFDTTYGHGLADAYAAGMFLVPERFAEPGPLGHGVPRGPQG